jgi:hypothetical protein
MGQYYENALCTISASRAHDSGEGFLNERPGQRYPVESCTLEPWFDPARPHVPPRRVRLHPKLPRGFDPLLSPLSRRGWVLQERVLSRRILHWCEEALYFECSGGHASEFGLHLAPTDHREPHMNLETMLTRPRDEILGRDWLDLVERYTRMHLSRESDRLAAITGLANRLKEYCTDEYLFGLWRSNLLMGLTWKRDSKHTTCTKDDMCAAPSWSWASSGYPKEFSMLCNQSNGYHCEWLAELVSVNGETGSQDKVESTKLAWKLQLKGITREVIFDTAATNIDAYGEQKLWLDSPTTFVKNSDSLDCIPLAATKLPWARITWLICLVLRRVDESLSTYRRIGLLEEVELDSSWRSNPPTVIEVV